ncbi:MAG: hypothetical protein AAGK97_05325, partial [Bacteroidota bacterium]
FEMQDSKERILPFIACGIFYLWMFINIVRNPDIPSLFSSFVLGATIALFTAFIINIFSKISLHAIGAGGLIALIVLIQKLNFGQSFRFYFNSMGFEFNLSAVIAIIIFLAGLIGTSRLILKAHKTEEIFAGYFIGFCTQIIAYIVLSLWMN